MAKARARGANGAKGGSSHGGEGAGSHGKPATSGPIPGDAKAINARVCRHARDGDVEGLLDYAASQRAHMNHVNLTTAMHKLAQLAKDGGGAIRLGDWRFAVLHDRVQMALALQGRESQLPGAEVEPRCWSTLAWSYATLNVPGLRLQPVFDAIAELSAPSLVAFNQVEFTNLVWAFAKSQVSGARFFEAARNHIAAHLASFAPAHVSTLVWALVTAKHDHAYMLCRLTERFVQQAGAGRVDPVGISNLMWGLATANVHPKMPLLQRIGDAASELLPAFKPQELSITAWAFSRLGVRHDRLFAAVAGHLCRGRGAQQRMHTQGLANLAWAFSRQLALGSGVEAQLVSAMHAMLPRCMAVLGQFNAQELFCLRSSLHESGVRVPACWDATAFQGMAAGKKIGHVQTHDDPDPPPQWGHETLSEAAIETASTGTGDSGPYAHSDAESLDGDGLGVLRSDMSDGGTLGSARARRAVDYSKAALHRSCVPMHVSASTMVTAADGAKQVLQLPLPAKQAPPAQPFQREALHSLGISAPPSDRFDVPDQGETAEDRPSCLQPRPQQKAGSANLQAGLSFENQVCYIVKNTFIEESAADNTGGAAATLYASEPLPARAEFTVGKLLKFTKLRQRPTHSK